MSRVQISNLKFILIFLSQKNRFSFADEEMKTCYYKSFFVLYTLLLNFINAQNSEFNLSGYVKDVTSGKPLAFANISILGKSLGGVTDERGYYSIDVISGEYKLMVSYIGYKTVTALINITGDTTEDFFLTATEIVLQEISVYSEQGNEINNNITLENKAIEEMSSIFPDVFRSIQLLPGINVNNEFSAKFNVRGGNYDENLVLVNNAQVYEPFHVKEADNASIGIFNMDLIKKVNFVAGGFSARYGDRLSSVLNLEYREGNRNKYEGEITLSLTNFDGMAEGPLTDKGSFIIGARKSYIEYVMSIVDIEESADPSFYDVQGSFTYRFSPLNKLQVNFIHAGDDFVNDPKLEIGGPFSGRIEINNEVLDFSQQSEWDNYERAEYFSNLIDINNTTLITNNFFIKNSLSYYEQIDREFGELRDSYNLTTTSINKYFSNSFLTEDYKLDLTIKTIEAKSEIDLRLNPFYDIKAGISYLNVNYDQDLFNERTRRIVQNIDTYPDTLDITLDESEVESPQKIKADSYKLAGYVENVVQLSNVFTINAGARIDYFDINKDMTVSPRFSAAYSLDENTTLRAAWGFYYQSPIYRQLKSSVAADTNTQSQKATHYILGFERKVPLENNNSLTIKIDGYYKKYDDLISSERDFGGDVNYSRINDSEGYVLGADLYASIRYDNFNGWISYGWLRAREDYLLDAVGEFPRYTDQRHTLSIVSNFDFGLGWSGNFRIVYGSGYAYTPFIAQFDPAENRWSWAEGGKNSEHLPSYKRVDIRVSKQFSLFGFSSRLYLDVSNLLDFDNVYAFLYRFNRDGSPFRESIELWPIIPSLGMSIKF